MSDASMAGPLTPGPIARIIVPLDAASESRAAIDTAARLAAHAKAPLHGVFVEDEDLLRLASLPFTRQVTLGASAEPLTPEHIELHLRVAAERARRDLVAAATRHGVTCSFEIVRGASDRALAGASERDLVVAGGLTRPIAGHYRVECHCWSAIEVTPGPFLLVRHAWSASGEVVMLLRDRDPASLRLLEAAAQIADAGDSGLTVICPPALAGSAGFDEWLAERLASHPVRLQVELGPAEPAALRRRVGELHCRLLAVGAGLAEHPGNRLREFAEHFSCDLLIVR
jgi:nucleotide-binding universal stress UspA family protein